MLIFFFSPDSLPGNVTFDLEIKTTFSLSMRAKVTRGACVCTPFFSPACHLVEIDGEKCPITRNPSPMLSCQSGTHVIVCARRSLGLGGILTSLGRGSWECGWTSALGCSPVGGYWLSSDNSISPPGWWVLLKGTCTGWFSGSVPMVANKLRLCEQQLDQPTISKLNKCRPTRINNSFRKSSKPQNQGCKVHNIVSTPTNVSFVHSAALFFASVIYHNVSKYPSIFI